MTSLWKKRLILKYLIDYITTRVKVCSKICCQVGIYLKYTVLSFVLVNTTSITNDL